MNERIYKTMSSTGACSLAVGIIILATGITAGIMMIWHFNLISRYSLSLLYTKVLHTDSYYNNFRN